MRVGQPPNTPGQLYPERVVPLNQRGSMMPAMIIAPTTSTTARGSTSPANLTTSRAARSSYLFPAFAALPLGDDVLRVRSNGTPAFVQGHRRRHVAMAGLLVASDSASPA